MKTLSKGIMVREQRPPCFCLPARAARQLLNRLWF